MGGHVGYLAASQVNLAACALFYAGWLTSTDIELSQPEPTLTLTPGIAKTVVKSYTSWEQMIS